MIIRELRHLDERFEIQTDHGTEVGRRVTLRVHSDDDLMGCDLAVVAISSSLAKDLVGLIQLVAGLKSLRREVYQLRLWNSDAVYYPQASDDGEAEDVHPDVTHRQDVEYTTILVEADCVRWTGYIKHTSVRVDTEEVSLEELSEIAGLEPRGPLATTEL